MRIKNVPRGTATFTMTAVAILIIIEEIIETSVRSEKKLIQLISYEWFSSYASVF